MKAILTKYIHASNSIQAYIDVPLCQLLTQTQVTIKYPKKSIDEKDAHHQAAKSLCEKMHWSGNLVSGAIKDGYAFVFV